MRTERIKFPESAWRLANNFKAHSTPLGHQITRIPLIHRVEGFSSQKAAVTRTFSVSVYISTNSFDASTGLIQGETEIDGFVLANLNSNIPIPLDYVNEPLYVLYIAVLC